MGIFDFLIQRFPECVELRYTNTKLKVGVELAPKEPALVFMEHALNHMAQIQTRDEKYFLEETTTGEAANVFKNFNITEKYHYLLEKDKTFLWDQVQKLAILGDMILSES